MKKKIICSVLALSISLGGIAFATPDTSGYDSSISTIQQQMTANSERKAGVQTEIKELEGQVATVNGQVADLDSKLNHFDSEIGKTESELNAAKKRYDERKASMKSRVEVMYKNRSTGYARVVLGSENVRDFFKRIHMVKNVVDKDNQEIAQLKADREIIDRKSRELRSQRAELEETRANAESKRQELVALTEAKNNLVPEIDAEASRLQGELSSVESEKQATIDAYNAEQARLAEEEASRAEAERQQVASTQTEQPSYSSGSGSQAVSIAFQYLGIPYVWGGTTPSGFDCSGLVQYVYAQMGISIPRVTTGQEYAGYDVTGQELQPGDLVFWGDRGNTHHVGMYIGGGQYIHAPQTGDVIKVSNLGSYTVARRIVN